MAKRLLDDSITTSVSLASCSPRAQDAFPRFILLADDFGCFGAHPMVLKGRGWPLRNDVSPEDIAGWLKEFEQAGMAQLWNEGDRTYCALTGWFGSKGQRKREEYHPKNSPHGSKRKTPVPPPPSDSRAFPREPANPAYAGTVTGTVTGTEKILRRAVAKKPATLSADASLLARWLNETYPDIPDPAAFEQSAREAYPGVDLLAEAKKAKAWEVANPSKRKTKHARFLNTWFAKQQDAPRQTATGRSPPKALKSIVFDSNGHPRHEAT